MEDEYTLVTGVTGFIGSHVVEKLLSENYRVLAVVRNSKNRKEIDDFRTKGAVLVDGQFYDDTVLNTIFTNYRVSNVIHIAAVRGAGKGVIDDYHMVNVHGTEVLLKHSLNNGVGRFIYCSSVGVYGTIPAELPALVTTAFNGDNDYHRSKILAEIKVMEYIDLGLNAYIVRPTIAYGRGDNGFPSTLAALVRRRMLLLPMSENRIHLIDVEKLADVFMKIMTTENKRDRIFIAADASAISCRELADIIHADFYGTPYPSYLTLPDFVFDLLAGLFSFMRNDKWLVRILLISRSWYFDSADSAAKLALVPSETKEGFKRFLTQLKHQSHE